MERYLRNDQISNMYSIKPNSLEISENVLKNSYYER